MADGSVTPFAMLDSDVQTDAIFSPDGRWLTYGNRPGQ